MGLDKLTATDENGDGDGGGGGVRTGQLGAPGRSAAPAWIS